MMKKTIKNTIAIVLLVGFAVLALGSFGSSPSRSSSSGNSSSGCSRYGDCIYDIERGTVNTDRTCENTRICRAANAKYIADSQNTLEKCSCY